jgi:hypothetical protein
MDLILQHLAARMVAIANIPWQEWVMGYMCFTVMGFGLLFVSNFWYVHENLELYRKVHPKAATLATVLCILFWPLGPYIVRKTGEWILKNTRDPLEQWKS